MRLVYVLSVITGLAIAALSLAADKMYVWKDKKGVPHYTETPPPPGIPFKVIEIQSSAQNPAARRTSQRPTSAPSPEATKTDPTKQQLDRYREARRHNCEVAKKNLYTLQNVARIKITDASGEVRLLTDEEKQQRIEESKKQIKEFCGPDPLASKKAEETEAPIQ
ncbi:MAG: DUF4124 domain-containing protein [Gammaproteobacteria bacterium]|nr:MAG: DUF4124 domain-containing protein [Gammaproteobacteria bacterium]